MEILQHRTEYVIQNRKRIITNGWVGWGGVGGWGEAKHGSFNTTKQNVL